MLKKKIEKDPKLYIKRNMREVKVIDKKYQTQKLTEEIDEDIKKKKAELKKGHLPNYLVKFKKQAEIEK